MVTRMMMRPNDIFRIQLTYLPSVGTLGYIPVSFYVLFEYLAGSDKSVEMLQINQKLILTDVYSFIQKRGVEG